MKRFLLAGTAVLALAASGSTAHAQRFNFTYTGSLVTFTVPITGSSPSAPRADPLPAQAQVVEEPRSVAISA
jgi:hypothetical protein